MHQLVKILHLRLRHPADGGRPSKVCLQGWQRPAATEREVVAATAAELDGGGRAAEEVDGSRSKLVNRSRGEGFGSISIYMELHTVPT